MIAGLRRWLRRPDAGAAHTSPRLASFDEEVMRRGVEPEAWAASTAKRTVFYSTLADAEIQALRTGLPDQVRTTIAAADRVMRHEFDLLGSGPYVPRDRARASSPDGYQPIDWLFDPVARGRFPSGIPAAQWDFASMKPAGGDVKRIWELARAQHLPVLAQAYRLSGDSRYAIEIVDEIADFLDANPIGVGASWTVSMDVAIRAVNWALAAEMIRRCPAIEDARWTAVYRALFAHGAWIETHLENTYEVTSNHFLSNVVGLFYLGMLFEDLSSGARWQADARNWLEQEIRVQILPDGMDYESSIPYHRLVLELFLGAACLAAHRGRPMSEDYLGIVARMADFLVATLRPDGLMPQVGDADDGRLHLLSGYGSRPHGDPRHLLGVAAVVCDRGEWLALTTPDDRWELAWWGRPREAMQAPPSRPLPNVAARFADAGISTVRAGSTYLLVSNGAVGTKGFGNHKHNDQLSFEYHCGRPLVVDPGSYVYTSDPDARNEFRGTAYHNTLMIDDEEQNELRPEYLFRLFEHARPEDVAWRDRPESFEYTGRHHGYTRLVPPVVHERTFRLEKRSGRLDVADRLHGTGRRRLRWHFHFAPGVTCGDPSDGRVALESDGRRWVLVVPPHTTTAVRDAWYSPSYGVRERCLALDVTAEADIQAEREWRFIIDQIA